MSCIHKKINNICKLTNEECSYPCDKFTTEKSYCKYCFNARIYKPTEEEMIDPFNTELTDENDSSSCGVGHTVQDLRYMISSGHGEPVRIEIDRWNSNVHEWVTVGKYYPKYCPECGRRLDEYNESFKETI